MRYLIVGVGAVGSVFLAFLSRAGYECAGLVKKGRTLESISVEGIWGSFEQRVLTVEDIKDLPFKPDVVILSVRSYDTRSALDAIKELFTTNAYLLIAQNGYGNYETAMQVLGQGRVILSRIIFGAKLLDKGRVKVTVCADDVVLGDPSHSISEEFLKALVQDINSSGIPTRYEPEVYKYLMDKVIYNCALNGLGALLETTYGSLALNPHTRELMDRIIEEAFLVFEKNRIPTFHSSAREYKELFYNRLLPPTAEHVPSMLEDIRKGRTEIDSLNGAVVELSKRVRLSAPVNEIITKLVKAKEYLYHTESKGDA